MPTSPLEASALAILTGADPEAIARELGIPAAALTAAARTYQAAGQAALDYATQRSPWHHITMVINGRDQAEHTAATHVAPTMERLRTDGTLTHWWYLRKPGHWRFRYLPAPDSTRHAAAAVEAAFDHLRTAGTITDWITNIYEPETEAFGGPDALDIAHSLFSADSRCLLRYLPHPTTLGRRELMILLPTALARAAELDWYEQGQMWADAGDGRPATTDENRITALTPAVRTILSADINTNDPRISDLAESYRAFTEAGSALRHLANRGKLTRGLRAVCARHIIFAANRLGIPYEHQSQLIASARHVILGSDSARYRG